VSFWTTLDGRCIRFENIQDSHLINILKFIKKGVGEVVRKMHPLSMFSKIEWSTPGVTSHALIAEARMRGLNIVEIIKPIPAIPYYGESYHHYDGSPDAWMGDDD